MEVVERLIGGPAAIARIAGYKPKAPFAWRRSSEYRDAGDLPPRVNRTLLDHSQAYKLGLTAEHLIRGATQMEVEAILASRPVTAEAATDLPRAEPDAA